MKTSYAATIESATSVGRDAALGPIVLRADPWM